MNKIRLGVVGSGGMATNRMEAFSRQDDCALVALAARNPETGPPLAQRYNIALHTDWRDMVARQDLDAVLVFTHNESHGPIALAGAVPAFRVLPYGARDCYISMSKGRQPKSMETLWIPRLTRPKKSGCNLSLRSRNRLQNNALFWWAQ